MCSRLDLVRLNLPMRNMVYVIEVFVQVYNMVPVPSLGWKSHMEVALPLGVMPNFSNVFHMGSLCFVLSRSRGAHTNLTTPNRRISFIILGPYPLGVVARAIPSVGHTRGWFGILCLAFYRLNCCPGMLFRCTETILLSHGTCRMVVHARCE